MATTSQSVFCLIIVVGLFSSSHQRSVERICIDCRKGHNCAEKTCEINQDSCGTVRDKDNLIIAQKCMKSSACFDLNTSANNMRWYLTTLSTDQKRMANAMLQSLVPEAMTELQAAGINTDIEVISHYSCVPCYTNKCNSAPTGIEVTTQIPSNESSSVSDIKS